MPTATGMSYLRPLLSVTFSNRNALALVFRNAAAELPAHQRVHLGVLVDRPLHAEEQTLLLQRRDVRVKVRVLQIVHASSQPSRAGSALQLRAS